jgi:hypothetical protein
VKTSRNPVAPPEVNSTLPCANTITQNKKTLATTIAPGRRAKNPANCHSEDPAGDEESGIASKTIRARSFAPAQDDSIGVFFRSVLVGCWKRKAKREPPNKLLKIKNRPKKGVKNEGTSQ